MSCHDRQAPEHSGGRDDSRGGVSLPEKQAAVDRLMNDDASAGGGGSDGSSEPSVSEPVLGVFARMHPIGVVAAVFAVAAVIAMIVGTDFLIGNLALWHWIVVIGVIALSTQASVLNAIRVAIEGIGDVSRRIVTLLAWVVFGLQFFNVITRYTNNWFERDILFGQTTSAAWMSFGLLFIVGVNYAMRDGVNPRIDFWWAEFSNRRKAWLDFVLHALLFVPFLWAALRLLHSYAKTNLGFKRDFSGETDGSWPASWHVWETWSQAPDAGNLPAGPIRAMIFVGFMLFLLQIISEMIKSGFVLIRREDLGELKVTDAPMRVE